MSRSSATWTREQALVMSARGREVQAALRKARAQNPPPTPPAHSAAARSTDFAAELLELTRTRTRDLFACLQDKVHRRRPNTADLRNIASAIKELAELERRLAGRPLPGTRRQPPERPALDLRPATVRPILPSMMKAQEPPPPAPMPDHQEEPPPGLTPSPEW